MPANRKLARPISIAERHYAREKHCLIYCARNEAGDCGMQSHGIGGARGTLLCRTGQWFWPILFGARVIPEPFDYHDDKRVIEFGVGLTDLVKKPTKSPEELSRQDFAEGRIVLSRETGRIFAACGGV